MARQDRTTNVWFFIVILAMVVLGAAIIGYWRTQNLVCGSNAKTWVWTAMPPRYQCRPF